MNKRKHHHDDRSRHSLPRKKVRPLEEPRGAIDKKRELFDRLDRLCEEGRVSNKTELKRFNRGLYEELRRNELLKGITIRYGEIEIKIDFESMAENELMEHTAQFCYRNRIRNKTELKRFNRGLYEELNKREITFGIEIINGELIVNDDKSNFRSMEDLELLNALYTFCEEAGIKNKAGVKRFNRELYEELRRRRLLSYVLEKIDKVKIKMKEAVENEDDPVRKVMLREKFVSIYKWMVQDGRNFELRDVKTSKVLEIERDGFWRKAGEQ